MSHELKRERGAGKGGGGGRLRRGRGEDYNGNGLLHVTLQMTEKSVIWGRGGGGAGGKGGAQRYKALSTNFPDMFFMKYTSIYVPTMTAS